MTNDETQYLDVVYISNGFNVYKPNDVFNHNHDGVLLAKDAWECTKYHRAQEPIEGLKEAVEWFDDWLAGIEGDDSRYFKTILQAAKQKLESEG